MVKTETVDKKMQRNRFLTSLQTFQIHVTSYLGALYWENLMFLREKPFSTRQTSVIREWDTKLDVSRIEAYAFRSIRSWMAKSAIDKQVVKDAKLCKVR